MRERLRSSVLAVVLMPLVITACSGGGDTAAPPPTTGMLRVEVSDTSGVDPQAIDGARVSVIDGDTGQVLKVLTTDANGSVSMTLDIGQVQLKVAAQGYEPAPASAYGSPLPYSINGGLVTTARYELTPLSNADQLGWISGTVLGIDGSTGVANALVTASSDSDGDGVLEWHSSLSGSNGTYVLFNIPPANDVALTALHGGYDFTTLSNVTVTAATGTENQDLLSSEALGSVSGQVQFLSVTNSNTDIVLLHPETRDVIPGLRTFTSSGYTINGIPDGTFHAIASLKTDGLVLDPDHVRKFGVPELTVAGGLSTPAELDFAVTGAVGLLSPQNFETMPVNALTFSWNAYPSSNDYVLEVIDDKGNVVWGGNTPVAASEYTVPKNTTDIVLDLSGVLQVGKLYRLRVYASAETQDVDGFKLISVSEDLEGVFEAGPAQ